MRAMFFLDLHVICVAACGMKFSHGFPTGGLQLETSNYVQPGGWNLFADYKAGTDLGESWSMRREDVRFCSYFCFFKPCRSQVRQPADATVPTAGPVTTYFKAVQVEARVAADTSAVAGATQASQYTYLMRGENTGKAICSQRLHCATPSCQMARA